METGRQSRAGTDPVGAPAARPAPRPIYRAGMEAVLAAVWAVLGVALCAATIAGTALLAVLSAAGWQPLRRVEPAATSRHPPRAGGSTAAAKVVGGAASAGAAAGADALAAALRVAIVVPAHDEEAGVARTVHSLRTCDGAGSGCEVVVVADNCSDGTAAAARAAGARVLVRDDPERRGKGYALDFAFSTLLAAAGDAGGGAVGGGGAGDAGDAGGGGDEAGKREGNGSSGAASAQGFAVFAVVDADTVVDVGFVEALRRVFAAGADAAQVRYLPADHSLGSLRRRLLQVAFAGINIVRPRGRERLGLSAGIVGNGFALSRATLQAVPYAARSIVEDLEYHLRLVRSGRRVQFVDDVTVWGDMPAGGGAARTQRARWEGGRLRVLRDQLPGLLRDIKRGELRLLEPAADLVLQPLAVHVLLLLAGVMVPFAPTQVVAGAGLAVVAFHVAAAVRVAGGGMRDAMALAAVPLYVLWKLGLAGPIARAARRQAGWVRTPRGPHPEAR